MDKYLTEKSGRKEDSNKDDEDANASKKKYKQKFVTEWKLLFDWIDSVEEKPFCKVCHQQLSGGVFHLRRHEKSLPHLRKYNAAKSSKQVDKLFISPEAVSLSKAIKRAELKWCALICKHNIPFQLIDFLIPAMEDIYKDSVIAKSLKMKRDKATQTVVNKLGPSEQEHVMCMIRQPDKYFSLIVDETTDVSTKKSLVIIARFWDDIQMETRDYFLHLLEVKEATASGIYNSIKMFLDENSIPYKNIIGLAADNANVMMGERNGLKVLMKSICPHIFLLGCSCHSLHLCASHACEKLPNTVESFLKDVYNFFARSSKRVEGFEEFQDFCQVKNHKILHLSTTRWLSRGMVVNRILEQWSCLVLYFQSRILEPDNDKNNTLKAKAILTALKNPIFKMYLCFLSYVLDLISKVNIDFQSEHAKIPEVLEVVTTLYKCILKCFMKKGIVDDPQTKIGNINVNNPHNYIELDNLYLGAKVDFIEKDQNNFIEPRDIHNFKLRCLDFLIELANQIKKRFDFDDPHLVFASYFTPASLLSGKKRAITEWAHLFPYLDMDLEIVNIEWQLLCETAHSYNDEDVTRFWKKVGQTKNSLGKPMFPNLMVLVRVILSLPHSSAAAERTFSHLTIIKNKLRNKLKISTCNSLLHVKQGVTVAGSICKWEPKTAIFRNIVNDEDLEDIAEL